MSPTDISYNSNIAVWAENDELTSIAENLATQLQLPIIPTSEYQQHRQPLPARFVLAVVSRQNSQYQIALQDLSHKNTKLVIDYASGKLAYRTQHGGGRKQAIARAVGLKHGESPNVIDATAGLGKDAFILASLGCSVRMIERSALMACLLRDALRRAKMDDALSKWISARLQLVTGDASQQIPLLCQQTPAEVIYIDPMYPARSKSALVKKEMRFLHTLIGKDEDSSKILTVALKHALKRVVVKRPRSALPLDGIKPTHAIESKNTRYDVYMV